MNNSIMIRYYICSRAYRLCLYLWFIVSIASHAVQVDIVNACMCARFALFVCSALGAVSGMLLTSAMFTPFSHGFNSRLSSSHSCVFVHFRCVTLPVPQRSQTVLSFEATAVSV